MNGILIRLRALEPVDLELLYKWENDPDVWTISNTQTPYSKYMLKKFIDSSLQDIYTAKQLRLMMDELETGKTVGILDLFDFEPFHQRVGVGILVDTEHRHKGYAKEAIQLIKAYCFDVLQIEQLYCNIMQGNEVSLSLFLEEDFEITGNKKQWIRVKDGFKDEMILQCLRKK
ncbi:MAG: GNAT family N-acetyltransferase [Bacteroidales bacterium]|jgi:diamine N-acetyltransferase|nr:GNAT family N-acetyltransferase [Bacteroidales bacterium]